MGVTSIEWTTDIRPDGSAVPGYTANLWWGCEEVHRGCDHCYARVFARAKGKADAWGGARYAVASIWENLIKWQRAAAKAGETRRVFCGSMMDIFEKPLPVAAWGGGTFLPNNPVKTGDLRDRLLRNFIPDCPNLLFLLLTKRPGNIPKYVPASWLEPGGWPANVMVGTSVVDQATADNLIPQLLKVPGARRFLSCEPLLGPLEFSDVTRRSDAVAQLGRRAMSGIDWIIAGGESGPKARPMHPGWVRSIRDQCIAAEVAFHFKQWGEWLPASQEMDRSEVGEGADYKKSRRALFPDGQHLPWLTGRSKNGKGAVEIVRVGKKAAGRLLDGREWNEGPMAPAGQGGGR